MYYRAEVVAYEAPRIADLFAATSLHHPFQTLPESAIQEVVTGMIIIIESEWRTLHTLRGLDGMSLPIRLTCTYRRRSVVASACQ